MAVNKFHKVTTLPATLEADSFYIVKNGDKYRLVVTDNSGNAVENNPGNRERKEIAATSSYTIVAEDFTKVLVFTADTGGADIQVTIPEFPDLEAELQIISIADNVLNFVEDTGVTIIPTSGALTKTSNDGSSVSAVALIARDSINNIGIYGSLEDDGEPAYLTEERMRGYNKTGTSLDLSNVIGNSYNYPAASNATEYTVGDIVNKGYAQCLINAPTEPKVWTGDYEADGTTKIYYPKISGADFTADTDMEMIVESPDGTNVRYFFLSL